MSILCLAAIVANLLVSLPSAHAEQHCVERSVGDEHARCCGNDEKAPHDSSQCRDCSLCKLVPAGASIVPQMSDTISKLIVQETLVVGAAVPPATSLDPPVPPPPLNVM